MKKMTKAMLMTALICGTMYCGAEPVHANELDTFTLDEYVVTATRTPVKVFDANANISVITREEIENAHYETLEDALRTTPGVQTLNYGNKASGASGFRINGATNVVVLIDGVRANHASQGYFQASNYALDNVEHIEVLKGAASALYGADAKGGVINIITRKPNSNKTTVTVAGGNFSTELYKIHNEGKEKSWSYSIDVGKDEQGDYKDGSGKKWESKYDADTVNLKVRKELGEGSDLTLGFDYYKNDYKYENPASVINNPRVVYGETEENAFYATWNQKIDDTTTNTLAIRRSEYENAHDAWKWDYSTGTLLEEYINKQHYETLSISDYITKTYGDKHIVTAGFDYIKDEDVEANKTSYAKVYSKAIYLQDVWNFDKKWNLTSGIRYDNHSWAGSKTTPRFNLGYKFNEDTNMYVSYSEFFVAPTMYQYSDIRYGNMNLEPEEGENYEIGVNHKFDETFTMTAHYFERNTDNKIGYHPVTYVNMNIDEEAKGFDIQFSKAVNSNLALHAGYTYLKLEDLNNGVNHGGYLPKHSVNVGVDYRINKFDAMLNARGVFDRGAGASYANKFPENNYWVVDVAANYKPVDNIKIFAKINNLFDKYYAEHSEAFYGPGSNSDYYGMPGRSFIVGMEYSF